jgi:tRNA(fMet)-specific endonuclease VapC
MSRFMLDTNICVELLRGRAAAVFGRLRQLPVDDVAISGITLAELQYGVAKSARPSRHATLLSHFCAPVAILPFDSRAAEVYGEVRVALERKGTPIGPLDTLIAAHAMSRGMTLVTQLSQMIVISRRWRIFLHGNAGDFGR